MFLVLAFCTTVITTAAFAGDYAHHDMMASKIYLSFAAPEHQLARNRSKFLKSPPNSSETRRVNHATTVANQYAHLDCA